MGALTQMVSKTLSNIKNTTKLPEFSTSQFYCWIFFSFSQRSDIPGTERTSVTNSWNKNHKVKMLKIKRLGPVERVLKFVMPVGTHAEINWDCHSPNSPFIRWCRWQSMGTSVTKEAGLPGPGPQQGHSVGEGERGKERERDNRSRMNNAWL